MKLWLAKDGGDNPLEGLTWSPVHYITAAGVERPPPAVQDLGGGLYGIDPTASDLAAGVFYVFTCATAGVLPAFATGVASDEDSQFDAVLLLDAATGALWAGPDDASLGRYVDTSEVARAGALTKLNAHLFALKPSTADIETGTAYRIDAPAGAYPPFKEGFFSVAPAAVVDPTAPLGEVLRAQLVADVTVTALIGARIYPNLRPQVSTFPLAVYSIVSAVPANSLDGTAQTRLVEHRVQIDAYAKTYVEAHQVAEAITNVVANLSAHDLSAYLDNTRDLFDNETQLHRVSTDFIVSR